MLAFGSWPADTEVVRVRVGCQQLLSLGITASFSKPWHAISRVACSPNTHGLSHGTKDCEQRWHAPFPGKIKSMCSPSTLSSPTTATQEQHVPHQIATGCSQTGSLCCPWERSWSGKLQDPQPTLWKREINLYVFSHWDLQICLLLQRSLTCLIG